MDELGKSNNEEERLDQATEGFSLTFGLVSAAAGRAGRRWPLSGAPRSTRRPRKEKTLGAAKSPRARRGEHSYGPNT